jgi:hypothetical protein
VFAEFFWGRNVNNRWKKFPMAALNAGERKKLPGN